MGLFDKIFKKQEKQEGQRRKTKQKRRKEQEQEGQEGQEGEGQEAQARRHVLRGRVRLLRPQRRRVQGRPRRR